MKSSLRHWLAAAGASILLCGLTLTAIVVPPSVSSAAGPALSVTPANLNFGSTTLGTYDGPLTFTITNTNQVAEDFVELKTGFSYSGAGADDYIEQPESSCPTAADPLTMTPAVALVPGASCTIDVLFLPGALGDRPATLAIADTLQSGATVSLFGSGTTGYYQVSGYGVVAPFGDAAFYGDLAGRALNKPIVGMSATGDNGGYYLVALDGGIFAFGDAHFYGSTGGIRLVKPVVGMAATFGAQGYWEVASDGGIFAYGNAPFYGSRGGQPLNAPIIGMAATPDDGGYWLVATDGGIFNYGDAQFYGSTGALHLNQPIAGMTPTPDGKGYWLVANDGGIFAFGDAKFYGSTGGKHLNGPITGMAAVPDGLGYWFTASDGGLFNYGSAPFYGGAVGHGIGPVVGIASDGGPTPQAQSDQPALRAGHLLGNGPPLSLPRDAAP